MLYYKEYIVLALASRKERSPMHFIQWVQSFTPEKRARLHALQEQLVKSRHEIDLLFPEPGESSSLSLDSVSPGSRAEMDAGLTQCEQALSTLLHAIDEYNDSGGFTEGLHLPHLVAS